jgi:hypothetical protein
MTQLSLFDDNDQTDNRPLPLVIADNEGFPMQWHDVDGVMLYSVIDWLRGVMQKNAVKNDWGNIKREDTKGYISSTPLPYQTKGGMQTSDFVTAQTLYHATQRMKSNTGLRNAILNYLAKAGVILDEVRTNPAAAEQLIDSLENRHQMLREKGKAKRNMLTAAAHETHQTGNPNYVALTNAEYEVLFGAAKRELVKVLDLDEKQAAKFRDHVSELAIQALDVAETSAAVRMRQLGRKLTTDEQIIIVRETARLIAPGFRATADYLGIDFLSGQPLLKARA